MNIRANKYLPLATIFALTLATATVQASPGQGHALQGWEPSADHAETVVLTLKSDPTLDPEPACVLLQIGMNLMMYDLNQDGEFDAVPADSVTLFPTLGGVELLADDNLVGLECMTPSGPAPLSGVLDNFVALGGKIVICPLCWMTRHPGETATHGFLGDAYDIHELFLSADKVIDF